MTNIIKAPIQKIRRKGPDGEYHIAFKDIVEDIRKRLLLPIDDEWNKWIIVDGFIQFWSKKYVSDDEGKLDPERVLAVLCFNEVDSEFKMFSLRKLMPELECW